MASATTIIPLTPNASTTTKPYVPSTQTVGAPTPTAPTLTPPPAAATPAVTPPNTSAPATPGYTPTNTTASTGLKLPSDGSMIPSAPKILGNAYYNPVTAGHSDYNNAMSSGLDKYYNMTPYTAGVTQGANDVTLGSTAAIADQGAGQRWGGADSAGTAAVINENVARLASTTPEEYLAMPAKALTDAIQTSSDGIDEYSTQMQKVIDNLTNYQAPDVAPILAGYMDKINGFLGDFEKKAQDAYNNGMNDPGFLQAIGLIRQQSDGMRSQLQEDLNARNMGQSGIYASAMNDFSGKVASQEATVVSGHLDILTQNLQASLLSATSQRVAALQQFAGFESNAAVENAKTHVAAMSAALQGMTDITKIKQDHVDNMQGLAAADINNQRDNNTSLTNAANANATQRQANNQDFMVRLEQNGISRDTLTESVRHNKAAETIDWAKVNEDIRNNNLVAANERIKANAAMKGADAQMVGANAQKYTAEHKDQNPDNTNYSQQALTASNMTASLVGTLNASIQSVKDNKVKASDIINNLPDYANMFGVPISDRNGKWNIPAAQVATMNVSGMQSAWSTYTQQLGELNQPQAPAPQTNWQKAGQAAIDWANPMKYGQNIKNGYNWVTGN